VCGVCAIKCTKKCKECCATITQIKKRAWDAFSRWIRMSNADGFGMVTCYTCNNRMHWKEMHAGHGIPGRHNAVLFLEEIVKPQDPACNIFKGGNLAVFTRKLIAELGIEMYDKIVSNTRIPIKYTKEDYLEVGKKYLQKLEDL